MASAVSTPSSHLQKYQNGDLEQLMLRSCCMLSLLVLQAMSAPDDSEMQRAASRALIPNVERIKQFFHLSRNIEQVHRWKLCQSVTSVEARSLSAFISNNRQGVVAETVEFD